MAKLMLGTREVTPAIFTRSDNIGITREVKNGVYQMPTESVTFSLPNNATDIGSYSFYYAFYNCTGLTSVDLSALTMVSGKYGLSSAFYNASNLTNVNLNNLSTISGNNAFSYAFYNCTNLVLINLNELSTVSGNMAFNNGFYGCSNLTSVTFPELSTITGGYCFQNIFKNCTKLTSATFSKLSTVTGTGALQLAFDGCTSLSSIYFPALTTSSFGTNKIVFNGMLQNTGTSRTHTVHFPSNLQSTISNLNTYPLFGGTKGYVTLSFDLPATS